MSDEQLRDKQKVREAFKTCKGKELSDILVAYIRKYVTPTKKEAVENVFDGGIPQL